MNFKYSINKKPAICRCCNEDIPVNTKCVLLETYAAGNSLRLFFHPECFYIEDDKCAS